MKINGRDPILWWHLNWGLEPVAGKVEEGSSSMVKSLTFYITFLIKEKQCSFKKFSTSTLYSEGGPEWLNQ